jgi:hypothetical protein
MRGDAALLVRGRSTASKAGTRGVRQVAIRPEASSCYKNAKRGPSAALRCWCHNGLKQQASHFLDQLQITPCRGLRRRSAGMPGNQRRDPLGKRFGFPPAYGSTERGRRRPTHCFLLLT